MKLIILSLCVVAALAYPDVSHLVNRASSDGQAVILKHEQDVGADGQYHWAIETDNGISAHEHGEQKKIDAQTTAELVGGVAAWTSPEGEKVEVKYTADENGYHPEGSHLPTPPPIPELIARSLQYIAAHPAPPQRN